MKVLVTGGTGYIGSHTAVALIERGHQVAILDSLIRSDTEVLRGIEAIVGSTPAFHHVDIRDAEALDAVFADGKFDAVVHFAALKAVGESVFLPIGYFQANVSGTVNLLDSMVRHGCRDLVFSSSCTVYGQPDRLPVTEDAPIKPASSPYGATKQMGERIIADVAATGAINAIALRYFNPIGAHPSAHIGELLNDGPSNLVPYLTRAAAGASGPVPVLGTDYATPDGTAIRDYIDIMDLADAHVAAIERLSSGTEPWSFFNVGTGTGRSVRELIAGFEKATGVAVPHVETDRRPGDVEQVWADTAKVTRELGWNPTRSLEQSLASAWAWQQRNRWLPTERADS